MTRLFLIRPPSPRRSPGGADASLALGSPIDGTLDYEIDEDRFAASLPSLERLARRNPATIFASPSARSRRVVSELVQRIEVPVEIEVDLGPRFLGGWQSAQPESLGAEWGRFLADRHCGAPEDAEPLELAHARVLETLDRIAGRFARREVIVVLHADGIRAAMARALQAPDSHVFALEPGQVAALDWAHPGAKEFKHAVIGVGFDWDVPRPSLQVHRFPGGASVLPRPS